MVEEGKRERPGRTKQGYVRVCGEIPQSVNDIFLEYERKTNRKINKSKIIVTALENEAIKVQKELQNLKIE